MKPRRTADLQRCVLAAVLLLCLYVGSAFVALQGGFSPAIIVLFVLGAGSLAVAVGLWQMQRWVWHPAHVLALLGLLLGLVGLFERFSGGLLDLPTATLITLVSALLFVFVRRRDVRRALRR